MNLLNGFIRGCVASLEFGGLLLLAGCAGAPEAINLPGDASDPARQLYIVKCSKCHKFYDPAKYAAGDWTVWMRKMSRKAKLTAEEEKLIKEYVDTNLRTSR